MKKVACLIGLLMPWVYVVTLAAQVPQRITLNFQDMPVKSAVQIMAQLLQMNMVVSPKISGTVALHLDNVTPLAAYQALINGYRLVDQIHQGVHHVLPEFEAIATDQQAVVLAQEDLKLQPVHTLVWPVHYAQAAVLSKLLANQQHGLLSKRGHILVDARTNTLIIDDTAQKLTEIKTILSRLDVPVRQIMIRAKIAVVNSRALTAYGVQLNTVGTDTRNTMGILSAHLNLPVAGAAGSIGFSLGQLVDGSRLNLVLQALQSQGKGEVLSAPKLIVANRQQAYIEQGDEVPFNTATPTGATQVEFKKAVLGLYVTPQITPKGAVLLDLKVTKDFITKDKGTAGNIPIIATSVIKTQVLVPNGQTVVLGGIMNQQTRHDTKQVPWLGRVPVLGWLFRHTDHSAKQEELLIFVTPKLLVQSS